VQTSRVLSNLFHLLFLSLSKRRSNISRDREKCQHDSEPNKGTPTQDLVKECKAKGYLKRNIKNYRYSAFQRPSITKGGKIWDVLIIKKSRPEVMLFRSVVTKLLIFPMRFPSDFFESSFGFSLDSLALGSVDAFKVVCEPALEGSREGTTVDTSELSRALPLPEATSETSPDVDTEALSAVTTLAALSGLRSLASTSGVGFASVAASAFKRMRKLCSKTSCVRRTSVRTRVLVAM